MAIKKQKRSIKVDADIATINKHLADGRTKSWIAKKMGCSIYTITKRIEQSKQAVTSAAIIGGQALQEQQERDIDILNQLKELNKMCWELCNSSTDIDDKLATSKEIRGGLKLYHDVIKTIYDVEMVQHFQKAVLEALEETHPKLKEEAIRRINSKREMRGLFE